MVGDVKRTQGQQMPIYLIRHGETASNAARVVQTPETPLSERGIAQAGRLARRLAREGITRIVSSDLPRALMTAEQLRAITAAPIELEPRLQERNYGDIRGMAYADIGADILGPEYEPPGGERWEDFHARVDTMWDDIANIVGPIAGGLAIVTHGLVCFSLALRHLRLPEGVAVPRHWGNTSLTVIESEPPWVVRVLNCTAHLDDVTADDALARSGG